MLSFPKGYSTSLCFLSPKGYSTSLCFLSRRAIVLRCVVSSEGLYYFIGLHLSSEKPKVANSDAQYVISNATFYFKPVLKQGLCVGGGGGAWRGRGT